MKKYMVDGVRCDSHPELLVYRALKKIFPDYRFDKGSPPFLHCSRTGNLLEYDFYCEELKIAVDYNGIHHYVHNSSEGNWTGQSRQQFIHQFLRDQDKYDLSLKNGVYYLVVPYTVPIDHIEIFIRGSFGKFADLVPLMGQ